MKKGAFRIRYLTQFALAALVGVSVAQLSLAQGPRGVQRQETVSANLREIRDIKVEKTEGGKVVKVSARNLPLLGVTPMVVRGRLDQEVQGQSVASRFCTDRGPQIVCTARLK